MKLERIQLTPMQLMSIPEKERQLLILLGHALNEINVLTKLFLIAGIFENKPKWRAQGQVCQALVLGRTLTGKLNEVWELIVKGYLRNGLSKKYDKVLDSEGKEASRWLRKYFGKKNLVFKVRNSFAFHYSLNHAGLEIPADLPPEELSIYFGETNGNSLYQFAEHVMGMAMLQSINPTDPTVAFDALVTETADITGHFNALAQRIMYCILESSIGQEQLSQMLEPIDCGPVKDSTEIDIPFFHNVVQKVKRSASAA